MNSKINNTQNGRKQHQRPFQKNDLNRFLTILGHYYALDTVTQQVY